MTGHSSNSKHKGLGNAVDSGPNNVAQSYERVMDQLTEVWSFAGPHSEELERTSSQNVEAVAQASTILTKGVQEISREWFDFLQQRLVQNADAMNKLAGCRSLQDLVTVQSEMVRDRLGHAVEGGRRITEVSMRMADEAGRVITSQADRKVVQFNVGSPRRVA
jgi:phasin family protein